MTRYTLAGVVVASALLTAPAVRIAAQTAAPIVIQAKFDTATEHVLIPVTIGGRAFWCNPDTGFSALIALDRAKAVAAGLPVAPGVPTSDGNPPSPGDSSTNVPVSVGGVMLANQSIIVRTLPEEAPDMDCIIGVALLRRFVVEFDHTAPRLVLHERASYRSPTGTSSVSLVFGPNLNVPYVDIQMTLGNGLPAPLRVVVDTGAAFYAAALVGGAVARVQSQIPTVPAITYPDPQTGRVIRLLAARPAAITVGTFTVEKPIIALVEGTLGGGGIADGVLGSGFFRRFTVAFDFDGRMMYLTPNQRLTQPQLFEGSGIGFIRRDGRFVVFQVIPDSAGAVAGVRTGDVLVDIDGQPGSGLTPVQLRDLLSADGATRRLVFEREGNRVIADLRLGSRI